MVLRVKPTPTRLSTNSLYTPMDNTPLHSISSVCHPWGNCWRLAENNFQVMQTFLSDIKYYLGHPTVISLLFGVA